MRILSAPSARLSALTLGASRLGAAPVFVNEMIPAIWDAATRHAVDPVGAIAQSAKETNWGKFGGRIDARWRNTCGLKVRDLSIVPGSTVDGDQPLCHQSFASWEIGARAHVQHLVAYAGGYVDPYDRVDPRYDWVAGRYLVDHFSQLGGKWAPAADYGTSIETIASRIVANGL